jgi:NAD(P)-dependent dehydrogenase (short-subunit alcohol dehydrogenase family)
MSSRFSGKAAIVTGAAGGIGAAYARALAAEGARVVIADIDESRGGQAAESLRSEGAEAIFVRTDIASEESTHELAERCMRAYSRIDCLVNNAALFGGMKLDPLIEVDLAYYERFMRINMHGALLTTRAVVPHMRQQGGSIVNQSSTAAYMAYGMYSVAKYGLNALTFALARELGPLNIRINAIAPGPTETPALLGVVTKPQLDAIVATMPISRLGRPDDLVGALLFLLSDEARWVTGHVLNVDGGQWMRT